MLDDESKMRVKGQYSLRDLTSQNLALVAPPEQATRVWGDEQSVEQYSQT